MSASISNNILAITAQRAIHSHQTAMDRAVNRLSTGLRINTAQDDPGGLAVSERFRAQVASLMEAENNANYNINLLSNAEGAMANIDDILIQMRALSVSASNGALTTGDRAAIDLQFQQLKSEISRIANTTNYAGIYLLNGSYSAINPAGHKFHIGTYNTADADYYFVSINSMTAGDLGLTAINLLSTGSAQAAIGVLDTAIDSKDLQRARIGSYVNRLMITTQALETAREKSTQSMSAIRDADIASEMSEFIRAQVLMQAGVAMLSQANMLPQIIAGLIG